MIDTNTGKRAKKPKLTKWERFVAGEDVKLAAKEALQNILARLQDWESAPPHGACDLTGTTLERLRGRFVK